MPTVSESGNPGNSVSCGYLIMDEFLPYIEYKEAKKENADDFELLDIPVKLTPYIGDIDPPFVLFCERTFS